MSHDHEYSTVLVPVDVSEDGAFPVKVLELLGSVDVVLLGYYPVPSQAAPAQIKYQYESEAAKRLEEVAAEIDTGSGNLSKVLVFTHDRQETVDRVAGEHGCDAVLTFGEVDAVERILVPIRGRKNLDRILGIVGSLLGASEASVTLFHSVAEDGGRQDGESLLDEAAERLEDAGVEPERISHRISEGGDVITEIAEAGEGFDVLVLGETEPSLRERILGAVPTEVIGESSRPVFVVRKRENDE